jgi:MFS family permease
VSCEQGIAPAGEQTAWRRTTENRRCLACFLAGSTAAGRLANGGREEENPVVCQQAADCPCDPEAFMKFTKATRIIFLTIFVDLLGFGIIIPILAPISAQYCTEKWSGPAAALLMASFSLLQMIFSPFWGRLSDKYGRRPILLLSLVGSTTSYFMFAFSGSYALLLFSRIFAGVCGGNVTAAQAFVADVTDAKDRTAGMGLVGMAFGLGFALGPVLGGGATWLTSQYMPHATAQFGAGMMAGAICLVNLLWAWARLPESLPPEKRGKVHFTRFATTREALAVLRHPAIGSLILFFFLSTFAFANVEVSFSLYARKIMGPGIVEPFRVAVESAEGLKIITRHIYHYFLFIGLVMAFVQGYLLRRLVKFVPETILIITGTAILAVGLVWMPLVKHEYVMLLPLTLLSLGNGLSAPSILSLISRNASSTNQGNVFGTSQAVSSLARIVGPAFAGIIYSYDPRAPFFAAALIMFGAIWWACEVRQRLIQHAPLPVAE